MELLDIRHTGDGRLRACLAHGGAVEQLEGTAAEMDALGRALEQAAELAFVQTGWCPVADVVVGDRMVRVGLSGRGRVTLVTGPAD
jgi:hypothetical protein